jgi:tRNA A-37 threonylcarbamoyl transferase component Bud32
MDAAGPYHQKAEEDRMETEIRCRECSEQFPAHVVAQFGGMCPACVAGFAELPAPGEAALKPGSTFGRYEILEVLGRGGMGVVYKARQPGLDRAVALKVLSPRLAADPDFVDRFGREAKALARLSHPNIVAVHDCGVESGMPYLVMELVDGVSLRRLLAERRLPPEEAMGIVPQLCAALEAAHQQGVVHRDIKPENILIDAKGRVKVADFGLAMVLGIGASRLTQTHAVMGTPHYMAPEQVENPKTVDHRADIYSMGVVFYEMLTGELPLGAFPRPSEKAKVHHRLDEIVLRALAKEPERRYQKASELREDVSGAPRDPAPSRKVVRGYEWKSRATLFGWPLVHVCNGYDAQGRMVWARGIIAIGNRAVGVVAMGGLAIGLLAFGGMGIGFLAVGGGALGLLVAFGGGAAGTVAAGGLAVGVYATGGGAAGVYVIGGHRSDPEAVRFFSRFVPPSLRPNPPEPPPELSVGTADNVLKKYWEDPKSRELAHDLYRDGMRAYDLGDYKKAADQLARVPRYHPQYATAMRFLGYNIYVREWNRPEEGIPYLDRAYEADPDDPKVLEDIVRAYKQAGRSWKPK